MMLPLEALNSQQQGAGGGHTLGLNYCRTGELLVPSWFPHKHPLLPEGASAWDNSSTFCSPLEEGPDRGPC